METKSMKNQGRRGMNAADWIYHWCIGLMPVLYIYNVPALNISVGTALLLLLLPVPLFYVYRGLEQGRHTLKGLPFFLFYTYLMIRYAGSAVNIVLCMAAFLHIWGFTFGSLRIEKVRSVLELFALVNLALILLQYVAYYGLHKPFVYLPRQLLHEQFRESGAFKPIEGLYRPTSLFLEPAHYAQYCCFSLISALFPADNGKPDLKKAALISLGIILTTSGMGILLTFGILLWYTAFNRWKKGSAIIKILKWIPAVIVGVLILLAFPFFRTALTRVFGQFNGYNAIRGRTHNWGSSVGLMRGKDLLLGYGYDAKFSYYLAGLPDTIYKFGVTAVVLEFFCFAYPMCKKISNYTWCCSIVFMVLFVVAHMTGFFIQVFYMGIIIADAVVPGKQLLKVKFIWF